MRITAHRIGLPDFDQRVGDRIARAIEHPALDADVLPFGVAVRHLAAGDAGQVLLVTVLFRRQTVREIGANRLRWRLSEFCHRQASIGVAERPRNTMSNA